MTRRKAAKLLCYFLAAQANAQSNNRPVVTVAVYQSCGNPSLTRTLDFPSFSYGGNTTLSSLSTSSAPPIVTPSSSQQSLPSQSFSSSNAQTTTLISSTPSSRPLPQSRSSTFTYYVTSYTTPPYDRTITTEYASTTIPPSGGNPGTVIIVVPGIGRYVTTTVPYRRSVPITAPSTISTVLPSGTIPGTYFVGTPTSVGSLSSTSTRASSEPSSLSSSSTPNLQSSSSTTSNHVPSTSSSSLSSSPAASSPASPATTSIQLQSFSSTLQSSSTPASTMTSSSAPFSTTLISSTSSPFSSTQISSSSPSSTSLVPSTSSASSSSSVVETTSSSEVLSISSSVSSSEQISSTPIPTSSETSTSLVESIPPPGTVTSTTYGNYPATTTVTVIPYTGSVSGTIVIGIPITYNTITTTRSSTTSSPSPSATQCAFDNEIRTDSNGIQYRVACGRDTDGGLQGTAYGTSNSPSSFEECYVICDATPNCQGFTWIGAAGSYGNGGGNCYFKGTVVPVQTISFVGEGDSSKVAAIKVDQTVSPPTYPDTTTTASSSSSSLPLSTTTSTTTTTSSSSSSSDVFTKTTTFTTTTSSSSSEVSSTTSSTISSTPSSVTTSRVISAPPPATQVYSTSASTRTRVSFTSTPARLSCAREGYLVQNYQWYIVDIATGLTTPNGTIQGPAPMQAMGYNRCDGLLYATTQEAQIVRFGADLVTQLMYPDTFFRYMVGEVDNNCQYWAIRTADNDFARWIHIDTNPSSPWYGKIVAQGQLPVPQYFFADWAYVPYAGPYLWSIGIDQQTANAYLYRFDQTILDLQLIAALGDIGLDPVSDPGSGYRVNFGALYASADGFLYGSENLSGRIYRFSVQAPYEWQYLVDGPGTTQNDGARCIDNTDAIGNY